MTTNAFVDCVSEWLNSSRRKERAISGDGGNTKNKKSEVMMIAWGWRGEAGLW